MKIVRIKLNKKILYSVFIVQCIVILILLSCAMTTKIGKPVNQKLKDGVYEGNYTGGPNRVFVKEP